MHSLLSPAIRATLAPTIDYVVFIGRFQPFHLGHQAVAEEALKCGRKLIFILGSAHEPRMPANPWDVRERTVMIQHSLATHADRLLFGSSVSHGDLPRWLNDVRAEVNRLITEDGGNPDTATVRIIGRDKDRSSSYIKCFPEYAPLIEVARTQAMGATDIRDHYFANDRGGDMLIEAQVPPPVYDLLMAFRRAPAYASLVSCHEALKAYPAKYGKGPHIATDAVIFCLGHVLLITRGGQPGLNQLAFPGGFLQDGLTLLDSSLAELDEETVIKVDKETLRQSLRTTYVPDQVDRDPRARVITHVHGFVLTGFTELPAISPHGGDDSKKAEWILIEEALTMRERMFLDHLPALEKMAHHPAMR